MLLSDVPVSVTRRRLDAAEDCFSSLPLHGLICAAVQPITTHRWVFWRRYGVPAVLLIATMAVRCAFARFSIRPTTKI